MEPGARVCPFCGKLPGAGMFCEACGRNLAAVDRLPTRAEWDAEQVAEPSVPLEERCAAATAAFLAAMHAASDPGAAQVFPKPGGFRKPRSPAGWVIRPVSRDPDDEDVKRYVPGLVLTVEGRFHVLESEVRGWGQRDFPRFVDTPASDPIPVPADPRLPAELDAVLREHGVVAES
jgi:hypothetical protein